MAIELILVAVLPALLAAAAVWDLTTFTIPNALNAALALLFLLQIALVAMAGPGMAVGDIGMHVLAGAIALLVGFAMFAAGWIGGGDAKLFSVAALWLGWPSLLDFTMSAALLGGVLTLSVLALRKFPLPAVLARQAWLLRLADAESGIPYGVALASAALLVLPQTEIFRLAAG